MGYVARVGDVVKSMAHRYQIVKEINKGGFADAYKAVNEDGEAVFLKQYKSPSKLVPWFKPYFSYEAELNRRLKEDPVLQNATVYANEVFLGKVYKEDGCTLWTRNECLFQVFPFISGNTNLSDMIGKKGASFDWEKRLYACTVFAFALRKLHDADVIHCDLKPENVQVKLDNTIAIKYRPLLVDMDWSILSDKKAPWHGKQGYVGTVGYNSPEHLTNNAPLEASDVFTAAIILCEVLANRHPFESKLGQDDFNEYVLSGKCDFNSPADIPFIGEVSDRFRELVFNSLNVKPGKRPTMTDIHLEMMAMCKAIGKPKTITSGVAGIASAVKSIFTKPAPKVEEPEVPIVKPKPKARAYIDASMVSSGDKSSTKAISLLGDLGKFTTKMSFTFDQSILKRLSESAKYADYVYQFKLDTTGRTWKLIANPDTANATCLNGKILGESDKPILKDGDTISLKGRKSGKVAMELSVMIDED